MWGVLQCVLHQLHVYCWKLYHLITDCWTLLNYRTKKNIGNSVANTSSELPCPAFMWQWHGFKLKADTEKPLLRDHCHERLPVLTDNAFSAGPTFQYYWTCHQRPPVLTDHIFVANGVVFQDRFYCTPVISLSCLWKWWTVPRRGDIGSGNYFLHGQCQESILLKTAL